MTTEYMNFISPVISAGLYAAMGFVQKYQSGQSFDWNKFGITIGIGIVIGAISVYLGWPVTADNIGQQIIAYGGVIVLLERILKSGYKYHDNLSTESTESQ